jgi:hypothetical protein
LRIINVSDRRRVDLRRLEIVVRRLDIVVVAVGHGGAGDLPREQR